MKPVNTVKSLFVHPKDKIDQLQTCECVYEIPCKNCKKSYLGETGRAFRIRLNEHRKEAEQMSSKKFTQATRKVSVDEIHKSAITDHVAQHNHIIDWVGAKSLIKTLISKPARFMKPSDSDKRGAQVINRDILLVTYMASYFKEHYSLGLRIETPPEEVQWLVISNWWNLLHGGWNVLHEQKFLDLENMIYSRYNP